MALALASVSGPMDPDLIRLRRLNPRSPAADKFHEAERNKTKTGEAIASPVLCRVGAEGLEPPTPSV